MNRWMLAALVLTFAASAVAQPREQQGTTNLRLDAVDVSKSEQGEFSFFATFLNEFKDAKVVTDPSAWSVTFDGEERSGTLTVQALTESQLGVSVVVVIAAYEALADEPFTFSKKGTNKVLRNLRPKDLSAVVVYGESVEASGGLSPNHDEAVTWLNDRKPGGVVTQFFEALDKGLSLFPGTYEAIGPNRVLVIVSDGFDEFENEIAKIRERTDKVKRAAKDKNVRICVVGIATESEEGQDKLKKLVQATNGTYLQASIANKVESHLDKIGGEIMSQHVLRFITQDFDDGKETTFQLSLKHEGASYVSNQSFGMVKERKSQLWRYLTWAGIGLGGLLALILVIFGVTKIARSRRRQVVTESGPALRHCGGCNNHVPVEWRVCKYCEALPHLGRLVVRTAGELNGMTYFIKDSLTNIGSAEGNTIVLPHGSVSKHHAGIKVKENRFELADFASTNGVLVNGARITKQFLKDGDLVSIGGVELEFSLK